MSKEGKGSKKPSKPKEPILTLDEYLKDHEVYPGLLASFKAEPLNKASKSRTAKEWEKALEAQSKRVYKYNPTGK